MSMTWREFRKEVNRQMREQKISENTEIFYIDVTYPKEIAWKEQDQATLRLD